MVQRRRFVLVAALASASVLIASVVDAAEPEPIDANEGVVGTSTRMPTCTPESITLGELVDEAAGEGELKNATSATIGARDA